MARAVVLATGATNYRGPALPAIVDNNGPAVGPALPVVVVTASSGVVLAGGQPMVVRTAGAGTPVEGVTPQAIYLVSGSLP